VLLSEHRPFALLETKDLPRFSHNKTPLPFRDAVPHQCRSNQRQTAFLYPLALYFV
jgi:hypothetical protein